ncbi:MAG TPA: cytochrome c [Geminicoccaceae bacterium]|nr:cytochrome c [Geminicoccaceae bacterium]
MMHRIVMMAFVVLLMAPAAASAEGDDPRHGRELFLKYCRGCHGPDGRGGAHTFMPHVDTLTKKGYIELVPDEYLFTVIAEGGQSVGKSSYMPAWGSTLSEQDVRDLIAHIRSLPSY